MTVELGLAGICACLVAQGFFSGGEAALARADRGRLRERAEDGHRGAAAALQLLQREDELLATRMTGTTLALVTGATIATALLAPHTDAATAWAAAALFVPLALLLGDGLPRRLPIHHADALAPLIARPLAASQLLLSPVLILVRAFRRLSEGLLGIGDRDVRREDIVHLLDDPGHQLAPAERQLIRRVIAMTDLTVEGCMTPLVDVHALPLSATIGEAADAVVRHGYSRLPVFEDRVDNIVGVVHHRDLLYGPPDDAAIVPLVAPVRFIPESKRANELLREMRENNDPFAVVVDEYGGTVGVVSLEDVLEEIIGDIADERDAAPPGIRRLGDREWRVPARTGIEALEEAVGRPVPPGDYETVGGLLLSATGRIPAAGEVIPVGALIFHVEAANERAIQTVRVTVAP